MALLHLLNESGYVDGHGTSLDALCILTVDTAGSLAHCFLFIIAKAHFLKVCRAYFCVLLSDRNLL